MRLDRDICLGGHWNNKLVVGIKFNGHFIYPISEICHVVYTDFYLQNSNHGYVKFFYRSSSGDYVELRGYDLDKSIISTKETVNSDNTITKEIYFRNNTGGPLKLLFTAKSVDKVEGYFDYAGAFAYLEGTKSINLSEVDMDFTETMKEFFIESDSLTTINLENIKNVNVTNMRKMFYGCISLKEIIGLKYLNTSNVTDMSNMFGGSEYTVSIPDGSGATTYKACVSLTSLDLSSFNTSNVTDMAGMLSCCISLVSLDLSGFDTTNVTAMNSMFNHCESLTELNISYFNTCNVNDMSFMFRACKSLTALDLSNFDTHNVINMRYMFESCSDLTNLNLSNFDTSNVTNIDKMFSDCQKLHTLHLDNCSKDTINKIITSSNFPTNTIEGVTRKIYCKQENATDLTPPSPWVFEYIN